MHRDCPIPMDPRLRNLTIKPFHGCSHHCPYCDSRQEFFRESREATLGLEDWAQVFVEADELGTEYLDISGGEPTLYKALGALIWEARRYGWYVSLNSTGFRVAEMLDELVRVCLNQIIISILSVQESVHDGIRRTPGSWREAIRAMECLRGTPLRLILHIMINRANFRELPELIDFAFARGANGLALVYPENDQLARNLLLSETEIREFRQQILPRVQDRYAVHRPRSDRSHENLANLFAAHGVRGDFSTGQYWFDAEEIGQKCDKPTTFALIYSNGNVLPCNAIEYTHAPIVGNVLRQGLREIWQGPEQQEFRRSRMGFCQWCPIQRHTGAAVTSVDNPPYAAPVVRHVPANLPTERPAVPDGHLTRRIQRRVARASQAATQSR